MVEKKKPRAVTYEEDPLKNPWAALKKRKPHIIIKSTARRDS